MLYNPERMPAVIKMKDFDFNKMSFSTIKGKEILTYNGEQFFIRFKNLKTPFGFSQYLQTTNYSCMVNVNPSLKKFLDNFNNRVNELLAKKGKPSEKKPIDPFYKQSNPEFDPLLKLKFINSYENKSEITLLLIDKDNVKLPTHENKLEEIQSSMPLFNHFGIQSVQFNAVYHSASSMSSLRTNKKKPENQWILTN